MLGCIRNDFYKTGIRNSDRLRVSFMLGCIINERYKTSAAVQELQVVAGLMQILELWMTVSLKMMYPIA
jgi:hypothetical protein